ncbi:MAG: hypothetical protein KAJ19_25495 [Gammaproteobacteria bacterium]|nr:hypothetical protein [Gammaproteobacteria bacterium]
MKALMQEFIDLIEELSEAYDPGVDVGGSQRYLETLSGQAKELMEKLKQAGADSITSQDSDSHA